MRGADGPRKKELDDPLLCLSQNFCLCEQLMIELCYRLALTLRYVAMDGNKFSLAIGLRPVFIQLSSQINYHLDKLSSGEGHWVEFVRGVGIVTGGVLVRHDHCANMFSWQD